MLYTPVVIPFIVSLLATSGLSVNAFRTRGIPLAKTFGWAMVCLTWWTFCYIMEISNPGLADKHFWSVAKYPGATAGPVLWFVLALRLTRHERWLTLPLRMFLVASCVITSLVVATNDLHHWHWTNYWLGPGLNEMQVSYGFYFAIYAAVSYSMVMGSVFLFFRYFRKTTPFFRRQALWLALGCIIPLIGRLVEDIPQLDVLPDVDNVILLLPVAAICFALAIFRFGAFNILPIAHDKIIRNIRAGIVVVDAIDRVVEFNPYALNLASEDKNNLPGTPLKDAFPFLTPLFPLRETEIEVRFEQNGKERDYLVQISAIKERSGISSGHALVLLDVTERKLAERELTVLAQTDSLTGLVNRRHFYERAEEMFARFDGKNDFLTVMMIDLDHFKQINDRYGHLTGDGALRFAADTCTAQVQKEDLVGRYGGEEFVCLLPHRNIEEAATLAEKVRLALECSQFLVNGADIKLRASIGLAAVESGGGHSLEYFIDRADRALYRAKAEGRNRVRVWETPGYEI